jgi:hypothetical protein
MGGEGTPIVALISCLLYELSAEIGEFGSCPPVNDVIANWICEEKIKSIRYAAMKEDDRSNASIIAGRPTPESCRVII